MANEITKITDQNGVDHSLVDVLGREATVDLLKDTTGWVGKNKFNGKATSKTDQYGVTWTVDANDNNIVTVSGTPTGFEAFTVDSKKVLPVGEYVLSGISDMVNVVYNGVFLYKNNVLVRDLQIQDDNIPHTLSILQSDDYDTIRIQLKRATNGVACSGTGRIMITTPEEYKLSPTYEPYHESVEEMLTPIIYNTYKAISSNIVSESVIVRAVRNIGGIQINVEFTVGDTDISPWSNLIQFEPALKNGIGMRDTVVAIRDATDETFSVIKLVTLTSEDWLSSNNTFKANHKYQFSFTYLG